MFYKTIPSAFVDVDNISTLLQWNVGKERDKENDRIESLDDKFIDSLNYLDDLMCR